MTNLDVNLQNNLLYQTPGNGDEVLTAISKYQNHPSKKKIILSKYSFSFSFKTVSLTGIEIEIG